MDRHAQSRALTLAIVMIVFLALYIFTVFERAFLLIGLHDPIAQTMGVVLLLFPLLGVYVIYAEIRFAVCANRLIARLSHEGGLPTDDLPLSPSGRADRDAAAQRVGALSGVVEQAGERATWQDLLRLGLMQDAAGHRSDGRRTIVRAIRAERRSPQPGAAQRG
ncbi:hypothetical protein [Pseudoclavibacter sp. 13-3]|uniref:hypothetical protein n=1 Tax=Pseudoclavibacter sp. 13-3 TaxID=2901228 RepID=UPI001E491F2B|nr:hypothetical protein [Pseudoclavibacter sp. 13-3]MCD7100982.1 hypothetical protein [Pseudoclavibacter sp. 13-3]